MTVYTVRLAPGVSRQLDRIPPRIVPALLEFIYGPLAEQPRRIGKPLGLALEGRFTARRGVYRVIYRIIDDDLVVLVVRVAHRADAYR